VGGQDFQDLQSTTLLPQELGAALREAAEIRGLSQTVIQAYFCQHDLDRSAATAIHDPPAAFRQAR